MVSYSAFSAWAGDRDILTLKANSSEKNQIAKTISAV